MFLLLLFLPLSDRSTLPPHTSGHKQSQSWDPVMRLALPLLLTNTVWALPLNHVDSPQETHSGDLETVIPGVWDRQYRNDEIPEEDDRQQENSDQLVDTSTKAEREEIEIEYMDLLTTELQHMNLLRKEREEIEYMDLLTKQSRYAHLNVAAHLGPLGSFAVAGGLGPGMTGLGAGAQLGQLGVGGMVGVAGYGLYLQAGAGLGDRYLQFAQYPGQTSQLAQMRSVPPPPHFCCMTFRRNQLQYFSPETDLSFGPLYNL